MFRVGMIVQRCRPQTEWDKPAELYGPQGIVTAVHETSHGREMQAIEVAWHGVPGLQIVGRNECHSDDKTTTLGDLEDVTPRHWVNVYLHDRAYGGPEEGGWWFDYYEPELEQCRWFASEAEAQKALAIAQAWCDEENAERNSDISSVCSEGRYEASLEPFFPVSVPSGRPQYS